MADRDIETVVDGMVLKITPDMSALNAAIERLAPVTEMFSPPTDPDELAEWLLRKVEISRKVAMFNPSTAVRAAQDFERDMARVTAFTAGRAPLPRGCDPDGERCPEHRTEPA